MSWKIKESRRYCQDVVVKQTIINRRLLYNHMLFGIK